MTNTALLSSPSTSISLRYENTSLMRHPQSEAALTSRSIGRVRETSGAISLPGVSCRRLMVRPAPKVFRRISKKSTGSGIRCWMWLASSHSQLPVMSSTALRNRRRALADIGLALRCQRSPSPRSTALRGGGVGATSRGMNNERRAWKTLAPTMSRVALKMAGK